MTTMHRTWLWSQGTPSRILDVLDIEGGWWTIDALAHRLDVSRGTAEKALGRLKNRGLVESRPIPRPVGFCPHEWRCT